MSQDHPPARREGDRVPDVSFRMRSGGRWVDTTTRELFAGQSVVLFSLPGAFTPTCSSTHLPGYNTLAPVFKREGIDRILCVSVNDPYVMEAWGREQEADNVLLLPDGNGAFTRGMGMLLDMSELNFGPRSRRYSMLVRDHRIEKMFVEPDKPGDPFEVSDADTMLHYINPQAQIPDQVAVLTREGCEFCARAKSQLAEAGVDFVEIPLPHKVRTKAVMAIAGAKTVPQVFLNGRLVGGSKELEEFLARRR